MTAEELFKEYPELCIYDFEVFPKYWLLCIIDGQHPDGLFIETVPALIEAYDSRASWIWAGYNSNTYDRFILGALYKGASKADLYQLSRQRIFDKGYSDKKVWGHLIEGMKSYDVASFAMAGGAPKYSLKQLEAFMGHSIEESQIPFDYAEAFTEEQKAETRQYCLHDVKETLEVLLRTYADFTAQADIISTFSLGTRAWSYSKGRLTAEALQCTDTVTEVEEYDGIPYDVEKKLDFSEDEWSIFILPCVDIHKYTDVLDFFSDADRFKQGQQLATEIMGVPHTFGLGGIHGALRKYHQKGDMMHIDARSYYPSIMIQWDTLTRRSQRPELFKEIYDKRLALKAAGKKREQAPYKLILNTTFGISGEPHSKAYDPCRAHETTINGQLMLVMLLEMLEGKCKLIQSNTDGIIVSYRGYDKQQILDTCKEWEKATKLVLEYDEVAEIWQKDVNNYLALDDKGEYEGKGSYAKWYTDLDKDLAILRVAARAGLVAGSSEAVRETVEKSTELALFQKIYKRQGAYTQTFIGEQELLGHNCFRVFAVKDGATLYKKKADKNREKVAGTPESCCVVYGDLADPELKDTAGESFTLDRLDREWYTAAALRQYEAMAAQ